MQFNSYLLFNGDCEEAFKTYEKIFGGKIEAMLTHEGTPASCQVPAEWQKKILHARITIGSAVLMASDAPPGRYSKPQGFSVNIGLTDIKDAERIFSLRHAHRPVRHSLDGQRGARRRPGRLDWTAGQKSPNLHSKTRRNSSCQRKQHPQASQRKHSGQGARSAP